MKIRNVLFTMVAIFLTGYVMISCKSKQAEVNSSKVEYYRNLLFSETSFDIERGSHAMTPDEAKSINSYKFTYDSLGRLASVEFVRNDVLLGYSSLRSASKIVYTYADGKQIKHFFDKDNKQIPVDGGVFSYEYSLDDQGIRTGLKFYDSIGSPVENRNKIHAYTWSKLPDGMIKENRYNLANEETIMSEFCPFYELRFTYNEKGFVTRMANYQGDTLYNCTAENCGDIGVSYFAFENTEEGDVTSFSVHNTIGHLSNLYWGWAKRINKVDANGYVVETNVFDQDDEPVGGKMIPITQNVYDEHGALVKTVNMDKDRKIINNPENGIAYSEFKYDEQGQRLETLDFDKDGKPVIKKEASL
jgi:hypothetical protein